MRTVCAAIAPPPPSPVPCEGMRGCSAVAGPQLS